MNFRLRSAVGAAVFMATLSATFASTTGTVATSQQLSFAPPSYSHIAHHPTVAAFYYAWWGSGNWETLLQYFPELGYYGSADPTVINQHMTWCNTAGITQLIYSWEGQDVNSLSTRVDNTVTPVLAGAASHNVQVTFMIDEYPGRTPTSVVSDVSYLLNKYGASPALYSSSRVTPYLTTSTPRPVFFIYSSASDAYNTPAAWTAAVDAIHSNNNAVVLFHRDYNPQWVTTSHFDGLFEYGPATDFNSRYTAQTLPANSWYIPTATPGFDAYRSKGWTGVVPRNGGSHYNTTWGTTLNLNGDLPMVSITSFNEWTESTQIEPDQPGTDSDGFVFETYAPLAADGYIALTTGWAAKAVKYSPNVYSSAQTVYQIPDRTGLGLWQVNWGSIGNAKVVTVGAAKAYQCVSPNHFMYYQLDRRFVAATPAAFTITVDYFDSGTGSFRLEGLGPSAVQEQTPSVNLTNTGVWRTATFSVPNFLMNALQGGYSDFRISILSGSPEIGLVTVSKVPPTP